MNQNTISLNLSRQVHDQLRSVLIDSLAIADNYLDDDDPYRDNVRSLLEALEHAETDRSGDVDDGKLYVNFRYHDNQQVCTAPVPRDAWAARKRLDISDEAALLRLASEIDIDEGIEPSDISVEDVFVSMTFYTGP